MPAEKSVAIVGAGPAGLMAAEVIRAAGFAVTVYDAKPSACRKLLLAGTSGLNITHSESFDTFVQRYYEKSLWLQGALTAFDADALRNWCLGLGISTFVGSSGRVFTEEMKAAPLARNWLKRLKASGVVFQMRHRLVGMQANRLQFESPDGPIEVAADGVLLALGGASWPKLGSDGAWQGWLSQQGVEVSPLMSANCGFGCYWSEHLLRHAGEPLKNVVFKVMGADGQVQEKRGECVITQNGLEGSLVYAHSKALREQLLQKGAATLAVDLLPDLNLEQLSHKLANRKAKESFSKYLKRTLGLDALKLALVYECSAHPQSLSADLLAQALKALPMRFDRINPIDEAISSAGGVCEQSLDKQLMLKVLPGVFCAGEMLDWEAPTGGYLLTACFATGRIAGQGVCRYLGS
ncbi:TIGR03862 family flavoprotein [Aliiglaciecola sp. CAU 1673]|uniref:TIGR03862 family flavoprotein n=1 Tax=Aliiglaciecola sp. CAU 1673 TaxID=3032595 RepID=UPI0023DA8DE2|nr:TIGR03862 family flavoprotein [Aliiglaciecola sp. CAU 1673]MDF2180148.1 TIGR03862 family flavoprotein [Aliiglaciecola sp. CAU 1673]